MSNPFAIASSGLQVAQQRLQASAHNVANLATPEAHRLRVDASATPAGGVNATTQREAAPGTALEQDLVEAKQASYDFQANLKLIKTADSMLGSLLDIRA